MYLVKTQYTKPDSGDRYKTEYTTDNYDTADRIFHQLSESYDNAVKNALIDDYTIEVVELKKLYRTRGAY